MHDHLSDLAQRLGRHMAERCTDGLPGHFDDELLRDFPDESRKSISLALAELEADGLVTLSHVIGPHMPRARTTIELFIACDAAITGHDPIDDSIVLARLLLEKPDLGGSTKRLEEASEWERRRFNPAFALLLPCIHPRRVRGAIQNDYPTIGVVLADEDLVALRRYIQQHAR